MNEQQARFVRKLKVDQNCPYPTIARQYFNSFGDTANCSRHDAERVMYFDLTKDGDPTVSTHEFKNGKDIPSTEYRVIEYIFPTTVGQKLCNEARKFFKEDPGDGWGDFSEYVEFETA